MAWVEHSGSFTVEDSREGGEDHTELGLLVTDDEIRP